MKHISNVRGNAMHYVALATLLAASLLPALVPVDVFASNGQLTSRSVQLDSSVAGQADVVYQVDVTTDSNGDDSIGSFVVEFCSNNPIEGDSCTAPTGLDVNETTVSIANQSGVTDWQVHSNTTTNRLVLDRTGGAASVTAGTQIVFDIGTGATDNGVDNPSATGSFYARLATHTSVDGTGTAEDFGGTALSTADQVTVTAKVHETLSFSVTTLLGSNTTVTLGDANGVLVNPGTVYDSSTQNAEGGGGNDNAQFSLATNAQSGAIVRLSGDTLTDGANDIDAAGALAGFTGDSSTEEFGLHVDTSGSTNITADADYDGSGGNYALVNSGGAGTADITQAGGAEIANTAGAPTDTDTAEVEFAAQASNTTPAGVYTGAYTFIATGTF